MSPAPDRMRVHPPLAALRDRVASIEVVHADDHALSVLPGTAAVLGLQFEGRVHAEHGPLSVAGVTGIQRRARRYEYRGRTGSVLVRFTPQGVACLGVPVSELSDRSVALDQLLPPATVRAVTQQLMDARDERARVAAVQQLLLALPLRADPAVAQALVRLGSDRDADEPARVSAVARALGLSERQLERRFLQRVGVTPKRFASLRRFERAVALARTSSSLTAAALAAGYYDQSHFIREFRRLVGTSPGRALGPRR